MQNPSSILLHLDTSHRCVERIKLARQLAEAFDADVTALPCTLSALMRYSFAVEAGADVVEVMRQIDKAAYDKMLGTFREHSAGSHRLHWAEPESDGPWGFAKRALYADLLLIGQRDALDPMDSLLPADFLSSVLVQSGRPALVLPYDGSIKPIGNNVLVAWKQTRESARAVTAALPWLRKAAQVHLVAYGVEAQTSLSRLQSYLLVQDVPAVSLHSSGGKEEDLGDQLLSLTADLGSDLLVMGCYGHSRAREWVLGGVTRSVLEAMTLPVLMSH